MRKKRRKRRIKWNNVLILLFIIICITCLIVSLTKIIDWKSSTNNTDIKIEKIQEITPIQEITDNEETEIIEQKEIDSSNPYWDYIKMNLINVDFSALKEINDETIGWIQVNGTNINYPFVQTNNNDYYLTHSFDKSSNQAGWVFLDYRNNSTGNDKNSILYAHSGYGKVMFESLKNILTNDWLKNENNYVIKTSTDEKNSLWQVFSIYHIPTTSDYLKINFNNNNDFLEFGNMLVKRSNYNFNTNIEKSDKILTLSTCYDNNSKIVLHAKLIKHSTN